MTAFPAPIVALAWESATGQVVDLQGDPTGIRVNIVEGLDELPAARDISDIVPFLPGRLRQPSIADRRAIVLAGYVKTPDDASYRPMIADLQRAMDPTVGAGTLTAVLETGATRTIEAVPVDIIYVGRIRTGKTLSIELDADPYWRGPPAATITLAPGSHSASTGGTTATLDAVVEVDGPSSGAVSVVNADGVGFSYPALTAGQTLVVDAGARTALIGATNVRNALTLLAPNQHGEFFRVRPASDTFNVTGSPAVVRVLHSPTFL